MKCPNALQDIKKKIMYDFQKFLHEFYFLLDIITPVLLQKINSDE